jgi:hypothetical protein
MLTVRAGLELNGELDWTISTPLSPDGPASPLGPTIAARAALVKSTGRSEPFRTLAESTMDGDHVVVPMHASIAVAVR